LIVDAFTQIWESPAQLGTGTADDERIPRASAPQHKAACERADRAIVVAFKSAYLGADVPNRYLADYVRENPSKIIGFAGVDPSRPDEALDDIAEAYERLGLKGVAIAPAAQDFHPASSGAYQVYERLLEHRLPLLIHQGLPFAPANKLEYARPFLLDEVARDFPDLKIVIGNMGFPWIDETTVLLGKHANVFAEISGVLTQSWRAYSALLTAWQYGVSDKLLFGSGFPINSSAKGIEMLYSINHLCQGTPLPTIPREQLQSIVERPTLELLGISDETSEPRTTQRTALVADVDADDQE
jgi:hypothetical protein